MKRPLKKVYQYSLNGELLNVFDGVSLAAQTVNTNTSAIYTCCKGHIPSSCGYVWMYSDNKDELFERLSKIPPHKKELNSLDGEIWRDIKGYEGLYKVSNKGRIRTTKRRGSSGGIMKCQIWGAGYPCVRIGGTCHHELLNVHRLVAEAFLPNPDNLPCVNHKDEDKTNNCVENLEWCSYQYNNTYGTMAYRSINHPSTSKCIMQLSKTGEPIATYPSIKEASRKTGISYQVLISYLHERYHTGGGYDWKLITQE